MYALYKMFLRFNSSIVAPHCIQWIQCFQKGYMHLESSYGTILTENYKIKNIHLTKHFSSSSTIHTLHSEPKCLLSCHSVHLHTHHPIAMMSMTVLLPGPGLPT